MYSKRCYKICICSVTLVQLEPVRSLGLQYFFAENFRCNLTFYESENLPNSSQRRVFESEHFRFLFYYET